MHFLPQIWEENGGVSYSLQVAYLAHRGGGCAAVERVFFSYFPPLKPRCILWSGVSYSLKNTVIYNAVPVSKRRKVLIFAT